MSVSTRDSEIDAFHIPPDFDDGSVNIGLGSMLSAYHANQVPFQKWKRNNANFTLFFRSLKRYAYRPFSSGEAASIDPRSYFYMREFLLSLQEKHHPAAFVATWAHSISDDYNTRFSFNMPFHVNNVDLTVGANVLYAITTTILAQLGDSKEWFDEDLQMIYENSTRLIVWMIEQNFSGRPDLALTYYPSVYNFYWFTSRTLNILQTFASEHPLPYPVLSRVMAALSGALKGNVTADLLKRAKTDRDGLVYFEDFLGNDDRNASGGRVEHGEDRLCSTAMAVNALLYTWMEGSKLVPGVPSYVRDLIGNASLWLAKNIKRGKAYNVVFSGSVKAEKDLPFFYPVNLIKYLNGSAVPPDSQHLVVAVHSVIPKEEYDAELKKKNFGKNTPVDFYGYNSAGFPFWSSEPFTYAASLLTLTRYRALVASGQVPQY